MTPKSTKGNGGGPGDGVGSPDPNNLTCKKKNQSQTNDAKRSVLRFKNPAFEQPVFASFPPFSTGPTITQGFAEGREWGWTLPLWSCRGHDT